jgi:hypothetical protein
LFFHALPPPGCFFKRYFDTCRRARAATRWAPIFRKVVCDKHGIGVDGEYFGGMYAQLGRINVL